MRHGLYGPPPLRRPVIDRARQSARLRALDLRDTVSRSRDRLTPPRRLDFVGHSDFASTGDEFMAHFVELAALQPGERVLDVGCGIGRMARPLSGYLSSDGSYDGFDVNRDGIAWCRRRYRRHPNFRFEVADLFNARYNPRGGRRADEYRFPYEDASFDFVLATSVFTHLLEADAANYLAECARVLAPGGRLFATFFLLNDTSRALIRDERSGLRFTDVDERVAILDEALPEEAVAYDDEWVFEALRANGLELSGLHPGSWSGREEFVSFQDIVIAHA
jgi:SAM-dependent methyltransferase